MKTTYKGVEIEYDEQRNRWTFELRGSLRNAESLSKAKERIDAPPPKDKKPFARMSAYRNYGSETPKLVEVTSIAGKNYSGEVEVWISIPPDPPDSKRVRLRSGNERQKVSVTGLRADTPANRELVEEVTANRKAIRELEEKARKTANKLSAFVLPRDVEVPTT